MTARRLLLIDDAEDMRELAKLFLELDGEFEVETASDARSLIVIVPVPPFWAELKPPSARYDVVTVVSRSWALNVPVTPGSIPTAIPPLCTCDASRTTVAALPLNPFTHRPMSVIVAS